MVTLTLYRTGSLFSAPYQFFIRSHLSLGDECHLNTGYWVFTCPCGIPLTFPGHWTTWGEKTWLDLLCSYLKMCPTSLPDIALLLWTIRLLWVHNNNSPMLHNNHLRCSFFFLFSLLSIQMIHFTSGNNWPYAEQHEWVWVPPDYQPAWWVWALPPTQFRKKRARFTPDGHAL